MLKIISCCCKSGQKKLGPELAPKILIKEINKYTNNFQNIIITDAEFINNSGYQRLYDVSIEDNDDKILSLGGDHSIELSTIMSSLYKYKEKLKVIWVDAHADINTFDSSTTKK